MNNTVNTKENANVVHGVFRRGILMRIFDKVEALIERRNTLRQLNMLSDRMLLDIGIERAHIRASLHSRNTLTQMLEKRSDQPSVSVKARRAA